jgi:hypothetical protein
LPEWCRWIEYRTFNFLSWPGKSSVTLVEFVKFMYCCHHLKKEAKEATLTRNLMLVT